MATGVSDGTGPNAAALSRDERPAAELVAPTDATITKATTMPPNSANSARITPTSESSALERSQTSRQVDNRIECALAIRAQSEQRTSKPDAAGSQSPVV